MAELISFKDNKVFLSLCIITKRIIMNNCSKAPSEKEWITEIMETIYSEKVAFRLESDEGNYAEIWAPVENFLMSM